MEFVLRKQLLEVIDERCLVSCTEMTASIALWQMALTSPVVLTIWHMIIYGLISLGNVMVNALGLVITDSNNHSLEIINKQSSIRMVTVSLTEDGVHLDYKRTDIIIQGEITNVSLSEYGEVIISLATGRGNDYMLIIMSII